jgi:hypothetical protein
VTILTRLILYIIYIAPITSDIIEEMQTSDGKTNYYSTNLLLHNKLPLTAPPKN